MRGGGRCAPSRWGMTREQGVRPFDLPQLAEPLASQFRFLLEADRLKSIIRGNRIAEGSRRENTAEHSWHIALFALVLARHAVERVDVLRVVSMLLIHDQVEIDCGDTPLFEKAAAATQAAHEAVAARRLFGLLPAAQAAEFLALWHGFEAAVTADARFAKSVDRLQPILLNHAVGGGTWADYDVHETRERTLTCRIAEGSPALWGAAESVIQDAVCRGWLKPAPGT
jgi:putative hydrolases of HD superfamily